MNVCVMMLMVLGVDVRVLSDYRLLMCDVVMMLLIAFGVDVTCGEMGHDTEHCQT